MPRNRRDLGRGWEYLKAHLQADTSAFPYLKTHATPQASKKKEKKRKEIEYSQGFRKVLKHVESRVASMGPM